MGELSPFHNHYDDEEFDSIMKDYFLKKKKDSEIKAKRLRNNNHEMPKSDDCELNAPFTLLGED